MYTLRWRDPSVDVGKLPIVVPVGQMLSNAASVVFTGKGAANYGAVQQTNMMLMLENFAAPTPPTKPTVGQTWYDSTRRVLKVLVNSVTNEWKTIGGVQITENGAAAPANPSIGEMWLEVLANKIDYILYIYTGTGRYPVTGTTIGGWAQIFPVPTFTGAREEYDAVLALVQQFIGTAANGGNGAIGTIVKDLTNLTALDTSYKAAVTAAGGSTGSAAGDAALCMQPNSNDWDTLLAAAKLALNRLDLPASFITDISGMPFVNDGRPAPLALRNLPTTDVRYPIVERLAERTMGSITLHRLYAETMNVLNAALPYRYSLRGISGASGSYPDLDIAANAIAYTPHATYSGTPSSVTTATMQIVLRFANTTTRDLWMLSGGGFDMGISNGLSGGSAGDIDLRGLLQATGFFRITQDTTRVFGPSRPLNLTQAPTNVGFRSLTSADRVCATIENAGKTVKVVFSALKANTTTITIKAVVTSTVGLTSPLTFRTARIVDTTPNNGAAGQAFGVGPTAFNSATDAAGTTAFLTNQTAVLP